jgi:hypothetical protein
MSGKSPSDLYARGQELMTAGDVPVQYGDRSNVPVSFTESPAVRLPFARACGQARGPSDRSAEDALQSFDEVRRAERPAGLFRGSECRERGIIALIGNERGEVPHAVEHRLGGHESIILAFEMGMHAGPFPLTGAGHEPRAAPHRAAHTKAGYALAPKRRCRNGEDYLPRDSGLDIMALLRCTPREDAGNPVDGWFWPCNARVHEGAWMASRVCAFIRPYRGLGIK